MKSYNILKLTLGEFLNLIQEKTAENAYKMKEIYNYTNSLKKNEPDSEERRIKLKNALIINNEFISANKKYLDIHNHILDVINDLASEDNSVLNFSTNNQQDAPNKKDSVTKSNNKMDSLEKNENNEENLDFNNEKLKDKEYTNKLMQTYIENEEYEKCEILKKLITGSKIQA
jgi:hypothetical protein